tara:strand:- start:258 stop:461 length:204 start_codon:yes stop_codon:yes gene_type:complete
MRVLWELRKLLKRFDYFTSGDVHAIVNLLSKFKQEKENTKGSITLGEFVLSRYTYLEDFETNDKEMK